MLARPLIMMFLLVCMVGCGREHKPVARTLPLPSPLKTHLLPVTFFENGNLPTLTDEDIKSVLQLTATMAFQTLRLKVEFS